MCSLNFKILLAILILCSIPYYIIFHYFPTEKLNSVYLLSHLAPQKCPKNVVTVKSGGRLGNAIWEYLSIIAVAELYNLNPYTPRDIEIELSNVFDLTPKYTFSKVSIYCLKQINFIQHIQLGKPITVPRSNKNPIILAQYSARYEEIIKYGLDKVREELRFRNDVEEKSQALLIELRETKKYYNPVYVGVHYRGGDYVTTLQKYYPNQLQVLPDYRYYRMAMNHFRSLFGNVIFVFISIDAVWMHNNMKYLLEPDVYVSEELRNEDQQYEDLALLSFCNHSIINYGTFGSTAAILAGGITLAYDNGLPDDSRGFTLVNGLAKKLDNWHLCNNTFCNNLSLF